MARAGLSFWSLDASKEPGLMASWGSSGFLPRRPPVESVDILPEPEPDMSNSSEPKALHEDDLAKGPAVDQNKVEKLEIASRFIADLQQKQTAGEDAPKQGGVTGQSRSATVPKAAQQKSALAAAGRQGKAIPRPYQRKGRDQFAQGVQKRMSSSSKRKAGGRRGSHKKAQTSSWKPGFETRASAESSKELRRLEAAERQMNLRLQSLVKESSIRSLSPKQLHDQRTKLLEQRKALQAERRTLEREVQKASMAKQTRSSRKKSLARGEL